MADSKLKFVSFCASLAIAKLCLIAPNEIVSWPDDSVVYARQSLGPWTLGYPAGYPAWLSLCRLFGFPQRIAIELLYLTAAFAVAYALRKWFGGLAGYLTFSILAMSSSTFFLFDRGLADGFFACLTLFGLALTIRVLLAESTRGLLLWSTGLGGVLGIMSITRSEDPLLALWIICLVVASVIIRRRGDGRTSRRLEWAHSMLAGVIASAVAALVCLSLCFSFLLGEGVFARGVALMPGHVKLLDNLAKIQTGEPPIRFIPITKKSREMAYAASPTFAKYRSIIENPQDGWQSMSRQNGIPAGEIGGGWIWHAINTNLIATCGGSHTCAEGVYKRINSELDQAFHDGRLRKRFVINSLIGGNPIHLLSELPPSIDAVTTAMLSSSPENPEDQAIDEEIFDRAFVRRASLVPHDFNMTVQGWAFVNKPGHKITTVRISSPMVSDAPVSLLERPDVARGFIKQNGWSPLIVAFRANLMSRTSDQIRVTYSLDDGSTLMSDHLQAMRGSVLQNTSVLGDDVLQGIDLAGRQSAPRNESVRHKIEIYLFHFLQRIAIRRLSFCVILLAIFLNIGTLPKAKGAVSKSYLLFAAFTLVFVSCRVLFYSILDARAWPGNQIRYVTPAHQVWLVLIGVSLSSLVLLTADLLKNQRQLRASSLMKRLSEREAKVGATTNG